MARHSKSLPARDFPLCHRKVASKVASSSWAGNVELRFSLKTPSVPGATAQQGGGCSITTPLGIRGKGGLSDSMRDKDQRALCPCTASPGRFDIFTSTSCFLLSSYPALGNGSSFSPCFSSHFRWLWALHNISWLEKESGDLLPLRWERWVCWGWWESLRWRDFSRTLVRNKSSVPGVPGKGESLDRVAAARKMREE